MRSRQTIFTVVVSALAVMAAGTALATPERPGLRPERDTFATVTLGAAQLDFEVTAAYERAVVTVSGRGLERSTQRFKAGEPLSKPLVDKEGNPLADGMYRYMLRLHPRPEKGGGIETGVFYIDGGVAVSRETKRAELAGVREGLNRDRETWTAERMAKMKKGKALERPERQLGPPASKEDAIARQEAAKANTPGRDSGSMTSRPEGGISRPPGPQPAIFPYYVDIVGTAPALYFQEYPYPYYTEYMRLNGLTLRHYGYRIIDYHLYNYRYTYYNFDGAYRNGRGAYQGNFDWAYGYFGRNGQYAFGYYGSNIRQTYGGYYSGNFDFGSRNARYAFYGNRDYAYFPNVRRSYVGNFDFAYGYNGYNLAFAGWYNMHRAPFNVDIAYYGNYLISGYSNWIYANYGNNLSFAYGYFYNGLPYFAPNGFNYFFSGAYDGGTLTYLYNFMAVQPVGVGVGTIFPTADFEVYDFNDYAAVRLNNYYNTWAFAATPLGDFTVNKIGSGGQEFTVRNRFDASGPTMDVQGSVKGTQFIASSSRDLKTDFQTLDGKEVLASVAELPVMSWRFKNEDESIQHIGPVAEDFQAAFQLGDGKTIANIDADGVALAAIQGLHSMLEDKNQEIADLTKRLAALEELLQAHPPGGS